MNIKLENYNFTNILDYMKRIMSKESEKELKKLDHEEMKEESHQLELKENYEQDEEYNESED
ncbi:MAG: hypothetical protein OES23_03945 [Nitrosopumilus sp.]|jgi:hypothetical protein|nr:hypothetical protein [Nitrosopumilus sp.]